MAAEWWLPTVGAKLPRVIAAFRAVAYVEAASYLLLLGATFVKRVLEGTDLVPVLGPVHGIVFLVYLALVFKVRPSQEWSFWRTVWVIVAAAVPFGGFLVGRDLRD